MLCVHCYVFSNFDKQSLTHAIQKWPWSRTLTFHVLEAFCSWGSECLSPETIKHMKQLLSWNHETMNGWIIYCQFHNNNFIWIAFDISCIITIVNPAWHFMRIMRFSTLILSWPFLARWWNNMTAKRFEYVAQIQLKDSEYVEVTGWVMNIITI